jgi:Tim10/DDP family zinc finger
MAQTCWDKCMGSPGNYLSSRETACFENCAKRFLETTQLIMQVTSCVLSSNADQDRRGMCTFLL